MALQTAEVRAGISGELYVAPLGTTLPTDTTSSLNGAFKGLGYFSEDGVTETFEKDTEDITAWQNAKRVRTLITSAKATYAGTLIQTNADVIETVFGTSVTQTVNHGTYTINPGATSGRLAWVLQVEDGSYVKRICLSDGEITELGETTYATGEAIGYAMTLEAYSDPVVIDSALAEGSSSSSSSSSS
jgi:hypothetical protein